MTPHHHYGVVGGCDGAAAVRGLTRLYAFVLLALRRQMTRLHKNGLQFEASSSRLRLRAERRRCCGVTDVLVKNTYLLIPHFHDKLIPIPFRYLLRM